ncbi:MAG: type I methionyl aminopeptidase [Okeania sp. SIO3H1]|nr:type I methionyl aminopeptidase [Okeania sp. SIO3H1]NET27354.1 type I methionyl aminopeptidase [Okeania sp. SIO1I7]
MRRVGKLAANLLNHLEPMVQPGVSTQQLNDEAENWTQAQGAISAQLGYTPPGHPPFTGSICTSINEVVCHGIPNPKQILKDGDIINIDVTPILDGYHGDTSRTFLVGNPSASARKLVKVTEECMIRGIAEIKPGARVGDIGAAIQKYAEANGFSVVREMVGHGVGRQFHTEPQIPHYGQRGRGLKLRPGMVFTVEPMLNEGTHNIKTLADRWTVITKDKKLSAQFEHTVAVTEEGVEILTLN